MASTKVSENLPPNLDVTKASIAYGHRALPKLNEELNQDDQTIRLQALRSLCDLMRDPTNVKKASGAGIVNSCLKLMHHEDVLVRQLSVEIFRLFSNHAVGRETLLAANAMESLSKLYDDADSIVRERAHRTSRMLAVTADGTEAVLTLQLIDKLVDKLASERDHEDILCAILETLFATMKFDTATCLSSPAMRQFVELIMLDSNHVKAAALEAIKGLSFARQGKQQAVDEGAIPAICDLLLHDQADIRAQACSALMSICITTRAKEVFAEQADGIRSLSSLLDDADESVRLAAIQAINVTAEMPACREAYQLLLPTLERLKSFEGTQLDPMAIARAAERAAATIAWRP
eukprot:TRINITY_DN12119_c0_g2_i2.p2 TRINITY_DN12119_c0_g2~~TRINITY_DN12119_c0_g2_i2.p2  ORF type:complete len:349 (+),score=62.91 TRINITY_DN12119_c0_g2_i2:1831-2877(+)